MRETRTSGSTSGEWKRSMVSYSGTGNRKGRLTSKAHLNRRATPRLYSSLAGVTDGRARRRLIAQVRPLEHSLSQSNRGRGVGGEGVSFEPLPVSPLWMPIRVITSVAGPPK